MAIKRIIPFISTTYEFDDEALRLLANLEQRYTAWMDAERVTLPGRLAWKTIAGKDYLYRIVNGRGDGRSLVGRRHWQPSARRLARCWKL